MSSRTRWARVIRRSAIGLLTVIAVSSPLAQPGDKGTVDRLRATRSINLGHRDSAIPFSYLDDNNHPVGYAVDLCLAVVAGLRKTLTLPDLKVVWTQVPTAERVEYIRDGKIDIECGNTTATAERAKSVTFAVPHFIAGVGVLVRSGENVVVLKDLQGKRAVVAAGTTGEKVLARANAAGFNLTKVTVNSNGDAFAALEANQADLWITDDILLAAFRAESAVPAKYELLAKRHTVEPLALMLRKDDPEFTRLVDAEVGALIRNGMMRKAYERWFTRSIPPKGINLQLPPGSLMREELQRPTKLEAQVDIIVME